LQEDRSYCADCYYLIGVRTEETKAMYTIVATNIEAEKNYTHLLKLGEIKMVRLNK
jgi:hypothetical protein